MLIFTKPQEAYPLEEQERLQRAAERAYQSIQRQKARPAEEVEAERNALPSKQFQPVFEDVFGILTRGQMVEPAALEDLKTAAGVLFAGDSAGDGTLERAFAFMAEAAHGDPGRDIALRWGLTMLLLTALSSRADRVNGLTSAHLTRTKGLTNKNTAARQLKGRARAIAGELWEADKEQAIRIGDMAESVYRRLVEEGQQDGLPEQPGTLKTWIRPVAPGYAMRGGRQKKPLERNVK